MIKLYQNIKKLREDMGLSQDALAKLTGYTDRSSITKIEKGLVDLQQSKIELFAKALGTTTRELVGWDDEEPSKIIQYYNQLNDIGKHEAEKRVEELTYLPQYTLGIKAAHNDYINEPGELEKMRDDLANLKRPDTDR